MNITIELPCEWYSEFDGLPLPSHGWLWLLGAEDGYLDVFAWSWGDAMEGWELDDLTHDDMRLIWLRRGDRVNFLAILRGLVSDKFEEVMR